MDGLNKKYVYINKIFILFYLFFYVKIKITFIKKN